MYSCSKNLGTHKFGREWQWKHYHHKTILKDLMTWPKSTKLIVSMARCFFIQDKGQAHLEDIIAASYGNDINCPAAKIYYKQAQRANLLIFPAGTGLFKGPSQFSIIVLLRKNEIYCVSSVSNYCCCMLWFLKFWKALFLFYLSSWTVHNY